MQFVEQANKHHPTVKFTAEISDAETTFWIQTLAFTKAKGSRVILSLICARTSNLLKHFNTGTSPRATHQKSKNASLKAKLWDFSEQTLLNKYLKS